MVNAMVDTADGLAGWGPPPRRPWPPRRLSWESGPWDHVGRGANLAPADAQPLPVHLLFDVPRLPFDVYIRHGGELVLYASRGSPVLPVVQRAIAGLEAFVRAADVGALVRLHLAALARAAELDVGPPTERGAWAVRSLAALLGLAGRELTSTGIGRAEGPSGSSSGSTMVDGAEQPAAATPSGALGALLAGASLASGRLTDAPFRRGWLGGLSVAARRDDPLVARTMDGVARAVALAARLGVPASRRADLARAMAVRDLALVARRGGDPRPWSSLGPFGAFDRGLPWSAPEGMGGRGWDRGRGWRRPVGTARVERDAWRNHPLESARLVAAALGRHPAWLRAVVEHHERPDGSGFPAGIGAANLTEAGCVAALADAFVSLLPPDGTASRLPAAEVLRLLRLVLGPRFPPDLLAALCDVVVEDGADGVPLRAPTVSGGRSRPWP